MATTLNNNIPAPPNGFIIDNQQDYMSTLPEGFVLDNNDLPKPGKRTFSIGDQNQANELSWVQGDANDTNPEPNITKLEQGGWRDTRAPEIISSVARPALQGLGGGVGAIVGSGAGPVGTIAGAGLGYAGATELADRLDEFMGLKTKEPLVVQMGGAAKNIAEGAAMEMGGQALSVPLTAAGRSIAQKISTLPYSEKAALKNASEIISAQTESGPIIAKNIDEANALEQEIPGLKFTRGQKTGSADIIKFERARARMPGDVADQQAEMASKNTQAIKNYINRVKGNENIGNVRSEIERQSASLDSNINKARRNLLLSQESLGSGQDLISSGKNIREQALLGKQSARDTSKELFNQVPEYGIDATRLYAKSQELSKPFDMLEDVAKNVPEEFGRMENILYESGGLVTPKDLQGFRSSLSERLREIGRSSEPNNRMAKRLSSMIGEIDDLLDFASNEQTNAAQLLKTAQQHFKKEVIENFGQGPTGDILKKTFNGNKVSDAQIVSQYFKPGQKGKEAMVKFNNAFKNNVIAKDAITDAIRQDLYSQVNPVTGELSEQRLKTWIKRYKPSLDELGITGQFDTIQSARRQLDDAMAMKVKFDKSEASKILKTDIDDIVRKTFTDGKETQTAISLMNKIKNNKKAVSGLQNSIIDSMIDNSKTTSEDALGNSIVSVAKLENQFRKYQPAINVLFKDSPQKIKALNQYRKALRIMQRTKSSPLGGGSDTAENIMTIMAKSSGISSSRIVNIVKGIHNMLSSMNEKHLNALLNRAAFDPDFAYTLKLASKGAKPDIVKRRLYGNLMAIGLRTDFNEE